MSDREISISLEPGAEAVTVSALQALQTAETRRKESRFRAVEHICRQLMDSDAFAFQARVVLLMAAMQMQRPRCAIEMARLICDTEDPDPAITATAVYALRMFGKHEDALAALDRAIRVHLDSAVLRQRKGEVLADLNRPDEANAELRKALALNLDDLSPYLYIAQLDRLTDADVAALRGREIPAEYRIHVGFALASYYRSQGNLHQEFELLREANAACAESHAPWDLKKYSRQTAQLMQMFDAEARDRFSSVGDQARRPIFIVGMPRSGSTLLQQILGSHPDVAVAGETPAFESALVDHVLPRYPGRGWPEMLAELTPEDLRAIGQAYSEEIDAVYTDSPVFVDKNLNNLRYVGLLALIFPQARFLHAQRQPMATVLSCYQQYLGDIPYADDLENLAQVFLRQHSLGRHWQSLFSDRFLPVSYEALVEAPEQQSRALLEFLGLEWDDAVTRFHESEEAVVTASLAQVRRAIYRDSVDRWRDYAHYLEPARLILEGLDERVKPSGPIFG